MQIPTGTTTTNLAVQMAEKFVQTLRIRRELGYQTKRDSPAGDQF